MKCSNNRKNIVIFFSCIWRIWGHILQLYLFVGCWNNFFYVRVVDSLHLGLNSISWGNILRLYSSVIWLCLTLFDSVWLRHSSVFFLKVKVNERKDPQHLLKAFRIYIRARKEQKGENVAKLQATRINQNPGFVFLAFHHQSNNAPIMYSWALIQEIWRSGGLEGQFWFDGQFCGPAVCIIMTSSLHHHDHDHHDELSIAMQKKLLSRGCFKKFSFNCKVSVSSSKVLMSLCEFSHTSISDFENIASTSKSFQK